ncbi:hypothetical protein AAMO2058_001261200 [Amorphochlora amoebiformis]
MLGRFASRALGGFKTLSASIPYRPSRRLAMGVAGTAIAAYGVGFHADALKAAYDLKLNYALRKTGIGGSMNKQEAKSVLKNYFPHFDWMEITQDKVFDSYFAAFGITNNSAKITEKQMRDMVKSMVAGATDKHYSIIAGPGMEGLAKKLVAADPDRFQYYSTQWKKFPDQSDNIMVGGFHPINRIRDESVLFLASFHNNDATLSQLYVMTMLAESFPKDMTIILPFYPTATMERITKEGVCATANTLARYFSNLPPSGRPHRLMVYDLHTLQNRFYLSGNSLATLHTAFPLLLEKIPESKIDCVAFPDAGAEKRFGNYFKKSFPGVPLIVCGKKRDPKNPAKRSVVVKDGDAKGRHVVIVDDMVQSGGTLTECGKVLKAQGALSVSAFVTHGIFPKDSYKRFMEGGDRAIFENFWVTNTNPMITDKLPSDDVFEVLDITDLIIKDL